MPCRGAAPWSPVLRKRNRCTAGSLGVHVALSEGLPKEWETVNQVQGAGCWGRGLPGQKNSKYELLRLRDRRRAGVAVFREERGADGEVGGSMLWIWALSWGMVRKDKQRAGLTHAFKNQIVPSEELGRVCRQVKIPCSLPVVFSGGLCWGSFQGARLSGQDRPKWSPCMCKGVGFQHGIQKNFRKRMGGEELRMSTVPWAEKAGKDILAHGKQPPWNTAPLPSSRFPAGAQLL